MILAWTDIAWAEYLEWQATNDKILERINTLIKDIMRTPFSGIGKPEPLKFSLAGKWSRRINDEHRLVYFIQGNEGKPRLKAPNERTLVILQCKYHY